MAIFGAWRVTTETETFRIFPKGRDGKSRPVTIIRNYINLWHTTSGAWVIFKRFKHRKEWFWRDSRDPKHCSESAVVSELARLLFKGDKTKAEGLILAVLLNQPLESVA